jgi:hypothetical protein
MTDDLKDTTTTEAVAEDWAKVTLPPRLTGLPMAVWITENDGYLHDVRVKSALFMAVAAPGAPLRRWPCDRSHMKLCRAACRPLMSRSSVAGWISTGT